MQARTKKQVLFIHGAGEGAHAEDARLAASLGEKLGSDYAVRYPKMPREDDPEYAVWKRSIGAELASMGDDAVLVGHSIGGSVLIRILTDGNLAGRVAALFLVSAPFWHDDEVWHWKEVELPRGAAELLPRDMPMFLYHGRDDEVVPFSHIGMYAQAFPRAIVRALDGRNHQLNEDLTEVAADITGLKQAARLSR